MRYVAAHERVTRGEAVHTTWEERIEEREQQTQKEQAMLREQRTQEEAVLWSENAFKPQFLVPVADNFVETETVKAYEDRMHTWLKAGYPVHVIGPTGCGKTTLAMRVAENLARPTIWINGDEALSTADLVGGYTQLEQTSVRDKYIHNVHKSHDLIEPKWVANPLAVACQFGFTLVYNEFSRTKPDANNILLSVLEEGILELPGKYGQERYVKVHPDFKLILTSNNIDYAGIHTPQDALLDRLAAVHMDYYDEKTETEIVRAHTGLPEAEAETTVRIIRGLRSRLHGSERPGTRPAIMMAKAMLLMKDYDAETLTQLCLDATASKSKTYEELISKRKLVVDAVKTAFKKLA